LIGGLLALITVLGIGSGFTRRLDSLPLRFRLAVSVVSGVAIADLSVMLLLAFGGGARELKVFAAASVLIGSVELVRSRRYLDRTWPLKVTHPDRWFTAIIIAVSALNLLIAVAPSTKIDELHYHMLLPKRVLEDNGLYLYRNPYESAIFPQMAYQLGCAQFKRPGFPSLETCLVGEWAPF
jgi:hypothetical protein